MKHYRFLEIEMKKFTQLIVALALIVPVNAMAGNPSSIGDVIGNNGWYGISGHVGMWTGSQVIEVTSESPVIRQVSLGTFQAKGYWGARYGKGSSFYTMIDKGWNQRNYNPSYNLIPSLTREGKWESQCVKRNWWGTCAQYANVMVTARFRCDTFVNYMYKKGTGSNLVGLAITPSIVYNAMPKSR